MFHVLHEVGGVAPDAVRGAHVDRGVELPARPRIVFGRIAGAVEEHAVDAGAEHQVEVGLQLREAGAEMLGEPGERFARGEWLAGDVGGRWRILQHREVGVVLACLARIGAQPLDAQFG